MYAARHVTQHVVISYAKSSFLFSNLTRTNTKSIRGNRYNAHSYMFMRLSFIWPSHAEFSLFHRR